MSQRDLVAELRSARIEAPAEVRERVRAIAATAGQPRRVFTWRRALVLALPVAAALAAAVVFTRPAHREQHAAQTLERAVDHGVAATPTTQGFKSAARPTELAPAPARARVQRYGASLSLSLPTPNGVSTGVKRALAITRSLGGYAVSVHANTGKHSAVADLRVKVPRSHVQEAIRRLSDLGTITAEEVDIQDLESGLTATNRLIDRLQRRLTELRAQPPSDENARRIAALVARIERLQRAEAATLRGARFATIDLHLATPTPTVHRKHGHGPLHGLVVAFRWIGIGLVYAAALGGPLLLVLWLAWIVTRTLRRRREDALLSRP